MYIYTTSEPLCKYQLTHIVPQFSDVYMCLMTLQNNYQALIINSHQNDGKKMFL